MTNFSQQHLPLVEKVMVDFIAEYTEKTIKWLPL